jgi:hypothetical protein
MLEFKQVVLMIIMTTDPEGNTWESRSQIESSREDCELRAEVEMRKYDLDFYKDVDIMCIVADYEGEM